MNRAEAAVGYARLGTDEPSPTESVARQRRAVEAYCQERGLPVLDFFVDGGGDGDRPAESRPALHQAIELACRCKAILVAHSLSRLARSPLAFMRLAQRLHGAGGHLALIHEQLDTTTTGGEMFFRLVGAMGELEHDRFVQHAPFGFDLTDDGMRIVVNPAEQDVIRQMVRWHYQNQSTAQIAGLLNEKSMPAKDGKAWTADAVQTVLDHAPTSRWDEVGESPNDE